MSGRTDATDMSGVADIGGVLSEGADVLWVMPWVTDVANVISGMDDVANVISGMVDVANVISGMVMLLMSYQRWLTLLMSCQRLWTRLGTCKDWLTWLQFFTTFSVLPLPEGVVGAPQITSQSSFVHFFLFSTAIWDVTNSRPVHSLMLSSNIFSCLPCLLLPFTVPCKMVLARLLVS